MIKKINRYKELGIDPNKSKVRKTFSKYVENDYPGAFVNIVQDPEISDTVFTQHMDGDGSKFVQRALHYFETGDETIFQGAADDAISMNTGDIAASGFVSGKWAITDVININGMNLPKDIIMQQIALRISELLNLYKENGFNMMHFLGGETADLPTQVQSLVFDVAIYARVKKSEIISGNINPGDKIYGFASDGKARWENVDNSGIMSNGITLSRVDLMSSEYSKKYPFLCGDKGKYRGKYLVSDNPSLLKNMTVSEAILSPTRQWAMVIKDIVDELKKKGLLALLHGISMNTGGGATKIINLGNGIIYKKNMPVPPPIFHLIKEESNESWENMFEDFNCGVGIDVVGENSDEFRTVLEKVSKKTNIAMYDLGFCEKNLASGNKVILSTPYGTFDRY